MTEYNLVQKVFSLSMLSNLASSLSGDATTLQTDYQNGVAKVLADQSVRDLVGDWELTWGPYIFQHDAGAGDSKKLADNAAFVAKQGDVYVVAISGTNAKSIYAWAEEDFAVNERVPWPNAGAPSGVEISKATKTGLDNLLGLPYYGPKNPNLIDYLASLPNTGTATVIFTGHSLGGALAPALALYAFGPGGPLAKSAWNDVLVLPTAGASPGNQEFASFYASVFPPVRKSQTESWNLLVRNTLDVVPHAWAVKSLLQIPTLYGAPPPGAEVIVLGAIYGWAGFGYALLPGSEFTGKLDRIAILEWIRFIWTAANQHTEAYITFFGVSAFMTLATTKELAKALEEGARIILERNFRTLEGVGAKIAAARMPEAIDA